MHSDTPVLARPAHVPEGLFWDRSLAEFNNELDDPFIADPAAVQRVVFCSGKIYYDLLEKQLQEKSKEVAIVRIEQLYPFPYTKVRELTRKYKQATDFCWAQEEPENMGAWTYLLRVFRDLQLKYIGRPESASPATGSHEQHEKEQQAIINKVFTLSAIQQPVTNP